VYSNLGAVYIDTGDPKSLPDAEKALKKSIELSPSYPAYANLAALYFRQKRYAESVPLWEAALKLNDQDYLVWGYLVNTYEWMKEESKAAEARERMLALLEPLVKLKPEDPDAQANLATIYAKKNFRDKATIRIQAALALAPDNPGILENAAVVYDTLGDRAKAIQYAQRVLEKGGVLSDLKNDPDLQNVLADPNFRTKAK
jgi:serine/threonine-protein kinase